MKYRIWSTILGFLIAILIFLRAIEVIDFSWKWITIPGGITLGFILLIIILINLMKWR